MRVSARIFLAIGIPLLITVALALSAHRELATLNERADTLLSDSMTTPVPGDLEARRVALARDRDAFQKKILLFGLLAIGAFGLTGYFLNAGVIRRLLNLQQSMSAFVDGRQREIPTEGNNEIASMGRALEYLVTTLRRREETLEAQVQFQKTLLDTIPNPIFYKDKDGRFMGANAAFEGVVGIPPDDVVGKTPFDIDRPDLAERFDPQDRDSRGERRRYAYETQKEYADGRMHHVMIEKAQFTNPDGKTTGVAGVMIDITRLKEAERELQSAKELAEATKHAKSSFLAAMSHEIRTPMNGVSGMVQLLEQTRLDRDQQQMLRTVRESADALLRIIDDILDFSKIEAGRMDLEHVPVSLEATVNGVAQNLAPSIRKRGRDVDLLAFVDPQAPAWVLSDPVRLRQVLMNLAGNAEKFTEAGKVVIAAEVPEPQQNPAKIRFRVSDTGIGISRENQQKLFEAFTQAEGSITRRFGGTGLGLSISRRLIDMMGGEIGVDSALGQGATFWFDLEFDLTEAPENIDASAQYDLQDTSVLIFLTEPDSREFVQSYLQLGKVRTTTALTIDKLLQSCALADVIVIDAWPGSGGSLKELITAISMEASSGRKPGIVCLCNDAVRVPIINGVTALPLTRPFDRARLFEVIAAAAGIVEETPLLDASRETQGAADDGPPSIEDARAAGTLILAVEDHPVNRQVLMRQLHTLGYAVELATNGVEALEMWQQRDYGLVLTDCHMPEMDGFELTAAIRALEEGGKKHTPIIAATANALQGEAENCRRAGMDGYLSKPIKLDALASELSVWLDGGARVVTPAVTVDKDAEHDHKSVIDLSVLRGICHGDEEALREMLGDFIDINGSVMDSLMSAIGERNAEEVNGLAHKLKGSAGTAGAKALAEVAKQLEISGSKSL